MGVWGYDQESLSSVSHAPLLIINNLSNLGLGATFGKLYYASANRSKIHGFSTSCPIVGVGGHLSGGGFGTIFRKKKKTM